MQARHAIGPGDHLRTVQLFFALADEDSVLQQAKIGRASSPFRNCLSQEW